MSGNCCSSCKASRTGSRSRAWASAPLDATSVSSGSSRTRASRTVVKGLAASRKAVFS
jgi:hypothetical protein